MARALTINMLLPLIAALRFSYFKFFSPTNLPPLPPQPRKTMAPPRRTKSSGPPPPARTLILDNGAYNIKAGIVTPDVATPAPEFIPNCIARDRDKKTYIGTQLSSCKDFSEIAFRRPVEKGYLVNWEAEKEIWELEFFDAKAKLHCDPSETGLVLTEAPNALPALQTNCDQVVFEEFGFARYLRIAGWFNACALSNN
jgi:actin-related protein 6